MIRSQSDPGDDATRRRTGAGDSPFRIMEKYDFVAVDVETATANRMICQIGIAAVKDWEIVKTECILVQPPFNMYDNNVKRVHKIREKDTADAPTFDLVWQNISGYFIGQKVVAHSPFDYDAICKNLHYYGLDEECIDVFVDTWEINGRMKLVDCCQYYGIECGNHHDALNDAICCAKVYMCNRKEGLCECATETKVPRKKKKVVETREEYKNLFEKDLSNADPASPLYNRKVVITGVFRDSRKEMMRKVKALGADIDSSITKNINAVIVGQNYGPKKKEQWEKLQMNGFNIRLLYQEDMDLIFDGKWDKYRDIAGGVKDLDFTYKHFLKNRIKLSGLQNKIANKTLYWGKGYKGRIDCIGQMTGNLAASGDFFIHSETYACVLSDETIELLQVGEKDETIKYIEKTYNEAKSIIFNFKFIAESDLLDFVKRWCDAFDDDATRYYYDKYMESINS